jgi:hypothetical protein
MTKKIYFTKQFKATITRDSGGSVVAVDIEPQEMGTRSRG